MHQARHRQLVVAGVQVAEERRRLPRVVELRDPTLPGVRGRPAPRQQHVEDLVGAQAGCGIAHRLILPLRRCPWRPFRGRLLSGRRAVSPVAGTVTPRALDPPAAQRVDGEDGLARTRASATTGARWSPSSPRPSRRPPSPPPGSTTSATRWWEDPFRRLCASPRRRGASPPARPHPHPGRDPADPAEPAAHGRPLEQRSRPSCASPCTRPIVVTGLGRSGTTLLHELLGLRPRQPPAAAVGAAAHRPLRGRLGGPVRRRDHAHGRDGARLHRHARERWPAPDRVHLRLRPPVLERHVHRALQRGRVHGVAQRSGPDPDLRLAQAPSADAAVGGRAADDRAGSSRRPPTFPPCPSSSPPTPTHGS